MFTIRDGNYFPTHVDGDRKTIEDLPPGEYTLCESEGLFFSSLYFSPVTPRQGLLELEGVPFSPIKKRLTSFFTPETIEVYKDVDTRHFIGCMLYGPPGTGKTCFIQTICRRFINERGALVFIVNHSDQMNKLKTVLEIMRNEKKDRMVIVVIEELDKVMTSNGYNISYMEKLVIDFCDGNNTPDNVLLLCSTNNIDKIPDSLKKRPSRFSIVDEVDAIPEPIAKQIIDKFVPEKYRTKINVAKLSYKVTEQKVRIDQIKYIILNILSSGMTIAEAIRHVTKDYGGLPVPAMGDEDDDEEC